MGKTKGGKRKHRGFGRRYYRGKPLSELLRDLPGHGVGRLIVRGSSKQQLEGPTYMRILKVDLTPTPLKGKKGKNTNDAKKQRIKVIVEKVFRGVIFPRPTNIYSTSYLRDFQLIPKTEEEKYLRNSLTASDKGYFYFTMGQKRRIKEMIKSGMSPEEAKARVKEQIAREEMESANFEDNDNGNEVDVESESDQSSSLDDHPQELSRNMPPKKYLGHNISQSIRDKYKKFGDFSEDQMKRINNMIKTGMQPETAKQIEWERDIAFKTAIENESNAASNSTSKGPCPDSQLKNIAGVKLARLE